MGATWKAGMSRPPTQALMCRPESVSLEITGGGDWRGASNQRAWGVK